MTRKIAIRLKPIFKKDFKKARFQAACCITMYAQPGQEFHNKSSRRRHDRKSVLFHITKELYLDCLEALNERTH